MSTEKPIQFEKEYAGENGEILNFYDAHKNLDPDELILIYKGLQEKARRLIRFRNFKEAENPNEKIGDISQIEYNKSQLEEIFSNINSIHQIFEARNIKKPKTMEELGY